MSDLPRQLTSRLGDTYYSDFGAESWPKIIGVKTVEEIPPGLSSVNLADRIKAPLPFYVGDANIRIPVEQMEGMAKAQERACNPPREVPVKSREGHGFGVLRQSGQGVQRRPLLSRQAHRAGSRR